MVTSDFRPEVEMRPFRACAMHPAIIIGTVRSLIVYVAMGQIPRSTERISSWKYFGALQKSCNSCCCYSQVKVASN